MLFKRVPVVVRGGGDLASGVIYRLVKAGFPVLVTELAQPLAIRRAVSFASAVIEGMVTIKGTNSILVLDEAPTWEHRACIRCGKCVANCPYGLNPSQLSILCEAKRYSETESLDVMDCKECGCCTFGCPAKRPIVQMVRVAKAHLAKEKAKAEAAKT